MSPRGRPRPVAFGRRTSLSPVFAKGSHLTERGQRHGQAGRWQNMNEAVSIVAALIVSTAGRTSGGGANAHGAQSPVHRQDNVVGGTRRSWEGKKGRSLVWWSLRTVGLRS